MSHWLGPRSGKPHLDPDEVVKRLRDEFVIVEVEPVGAERTAALIRQLEKSGMPADYIAEQQELRKRAIQVVLADDPKPGDAWLRFTVMPDSAILVGYTTGKHEKAAKPLLARCRRALGYMSSLA